MLSKTKIIYFSLLLLASFFFVLTNNRTKSLFAATDDLGSAVVNPNTITAKTWGSFTLTYTVGSQGIAAGGGLKVQFPRSLNFPSRYPQITSPSGDNYVSVKTSSPNVTLSLNLVNEDVYQDRGSAADYSAVIKVTGGNLLPSDTIIYTFGDRSGGSRGVYASEAVAQEPIRMAVDSTGTGSYQLLTSDALIATKGQAATSLKITTSTNAQLGTPVAVTVVAQDNYQNNSASYQSRIHFSATDSQALLPEDYTFTPSDEGAKTFTVNFNTTGNHWITVTDGNFTATSNAAIVSENVTDSNIYWGDLHVHSDFSPEAFGEQPSELRYARDVSDIDFISFLDHANTTTTPLTLREWAGTKVNLDSFYQPNNFVTILGYEWSVNNGVDGHKSVYYRDTQQPFFGATTYPNNTALWNALAANNQPALTVPHHTGLRSNNKSGATSWTYKNDTFQKVTEIYQVKGLYEYYDPNHPLSCENVCTSSYSQNGPNYFQDALVAGQHLGVIAASDEHDAKPGRNQMGLAAVYAPNLTREAIFDAITARHTYATTGERIILEFTVGNKMMGDELSVALPYIPSIKAKVIGTDILDWVEIVKYDGQTFTTPYRVTPQSRTAEFTFEDQNFTNNSVYYLRVRQVNKVSGRDVMAWSSPIWIDVDNTTPTPTPTPATVEIVVDNKSPQFSTTGVWKTVTGTRYYGGDSRVAAKGTGSKTATWRLNLPQNGTYKLYGYWGNGNNSTQTPYRIYTSNGERIITVNQTLNFLQWNLIGTFDFDTTKDPRVTVSNNSPDGKWVEADAIKVELIL